MIKYTWITEKLYTLNLPTESNYVVTAMYGVEAFEDKTKTKVVSSGNMATFKVTQDQPDYIPYDQLTNDIVIGWIQSQLGKEGVASIEQSLQGQINTILNPPPTPQEQPLPFKTK